MTNWTTTHDILNWIPEFDNFSDPYGYSIDIEQALYHNRYIFKAPGKTVELHTTTNKSHLGRITITKELLWNHPLTTSTYVTININLPLDVRPEQFFPFVDEQLNDLLESL
jgi:hypothetical protein